MTEVLRADRPDSTPPSRPDLVEDVERDMARRLGALALVYGAMWCVGVVIVFGLVPAIVDPGDRPVDPPKILGLAASSVALSLAIAAVTRWKPLSPRQSLKLSLVYLVLSAATLGLHGEGSPGGGPRHGVSMVGVWILMFSMFVPVPPRKLLPAALVAASMDPLGVWISVQRGLAETPSLAQVFLPFTSNYILAGVGLFHAKFLVRLTRQIGQAREMGSYRLDRLLGRGGMGEVWVARHRMLARPAAVKLVRPEILEGGGGESAGGALRRFEREAQATAALRSPHTIELFDFGVARDGTFYYVMELLDGLDLDSLVRRFGPVPAARAVHFLRQACHSLADAHAHGLIHRDIKPANLFTCRLGLDCDFVKVLDFGLVKSARGAGPGGDALQSRMHDGAGTPAFMPPEMFLAESPIDARTDLYALGCVGYWLLTGRLVFEADSPMRMLMRHAQDPPVPPSQVAEVDVPPELDELLLACLAKSPDERPADAAALARSLEGIAAVHPWRPETAQRWWETHRPESGDEIAEPATPDSATWLLAQSGPR